MKNINVSKLRRLKFQGHYKQMQLKQAAVTQIPLIFVVRKNCEIR